MTAELNNSRADLVAANDELALDLLPVILFLSVMIVLGVLGNSLVCYIFCFRLRPSTQNYLIVYLAVYDLISSTMAMPSGIIFMRYIIMFESEVACKIMRVINMFGVVGSVYTLVVIAVDRFRKVCRPLKGQLNVKHIKYSLIPINCIAIFYAVPLVFIYGLRKVESGVPGFPGTDCSPTNVTSFPLVYNVFLFMSFVVLTTSLMVIYYRVLRETKRHTRYMKENPISLLTKSHPGHTKDLSHGANIVDLPSVSLSIEDSFSTYKMMHTLSETHFLPNSPTQTDTSLRPSPPECQLCKVPLFHSETNDQMTSHLPSASPNDGGNDVTTAPEHPSTSTSNPEAFCVTHETTPPCQETNKYSFNKTKRVQSKTTMIAFLITLVFILSFLPHLSVRALNRVMKDFDAKLRGAGLVFYHICFRSYILNSVLNPFIYGALNTKFKKEVKRLARKAKMLCKRK